MNTLRKAGLRAFEITALVGFLPLPCLLYRLMAGGGGSGGSGPLLALGLYLAGYLAALALMGLALRRALLRAERLRSGRASWLPPTAWDEAAR